jgi:molybdate transport system substrate-binding protein
MTSAFPRRAFVRAGALAVVAFCLVWSTGDAPAAPKTSQKLTVFAAASLLDAFNAIGKQFEKAHPGVKVRMQYAGSQQLVAQIEQGADADVLASADDRWMGYAVEHGFIAGTPQVFARNVLVVIVPRMNPGRIDKLEDLSRRGVKVVIGAEAVPVGAYAREVLHRLSADPAMGEDYGASVLRNVVSQEENVKSIVAKVQLGEADAGIVYRSDVTPAVGRHVKMFEIPKAAAVIAAYPIAATKTRNAELAQSFIDYVHSPAGQAALAHEHFLPWK